MDFIWYYPKTAGTATCYEAFDWNKDLFPFLLNLNRLISLKAKYFYYFFLKLIISYKY